MLNIWAIFNKMCPFLDTSFLWYSSEILIGCLPTTHKSKNTIWNRSLHEISNSFCEKAHPSSIYTRFNTRYVIPLFSYTDTLFEWSRIKIIQLEFPLFWYETFFLCLKQVYCCLTFFCMYISLQCTKNISFIQFLNFLNSFPCLILPCLFTRKGGGGVGTSSTFFLKPHILLQVNMTFSIS